MNQKQATPSELFPNYKLNVPTHFQYLLATGLGGGVIGLIVMVSSPSSQSLLASILLTIGLFALGLTALLTLVLGERPRLAARRTMINEVVWRGDERVLDVGCGNGLLLLEAAKHLTTGKAIGIDLWLESAGGQSAATLWHNAQLEGVSDKIDVQNVDARHLPFEDATFDVILSSLALHHVGTTVERERAVEEMIRVLKPGGKLLLYDAFPIIRHAVTVLRRRKLSQLKKLNGAILPVLVVSK